MFAFLNTRIKRTPSKALCVGVFGPILPSSFEFELKKKYIKFKSIYTVFYQKFHQSGHQMDLKKILERPD